MERDEAIRFLTHDESGEYTGGLLVPCSRWGRNGAACAEVAYDLDVILSAETGRGVDRDTLDYAMSLVVNDHDDVGYTLYNYGDDEIRERYADELAEYGPQYVASINIPGYLPWDDDPPTFSTARAAWEYLAGERERDMTGDGSLLDDPDTQGDTTHADLLAAAESGEEGTVFGPTPGYDGGHDLGLAYSVSLTELDGS